MVQRPLFSGDTAGTKLFARTIVTHKKHGDKKHGDEKHGGFRKKYGGPRNKHGAIWKKHDSAQEKIWYQKKTWWHQNEMATSWRTLSGRRPVPKCKECNDLSRGKNTKSFLCSECDQGVCFVLSECILCPCCAQMVLFVLLYSGAVFLPQSKVKKLSTKMSSQGAWSNLHVTYRDRTNR